MAEIALSRREKKLIQGDKRSWRPAGSTIVCCSDSFIRRKWLEICCDFASPAKRHDPAFQSIPGWHRIKQAWTPALRRAWLRADKPNPGYPLGELLMNVAKPQSLWNQHVVPTGLVSDIPLAPESNTVQACDTWLWSRREKKRFYVIVNDDATDEEVQSWQGIEPRDYDTGEVLPKLIGNQTYDPSIKVAYVWKKRIKWRTELALTQQEIDDIDNLDHELHPRHDRKVGKNKANRPNIAGMHL